MHHISYSEFRSHLRRIMDKVNDDHTPVLITRQNGKPAVLISLDDFNAFDETAYLLASPANKKALLEAIADVEAGKVVYHDLIED